MRELCDRHDVEYLQIYGHVERKGTLRSGPAERDYRAFLGTKYFVSTKMQEAVKTSCGHLRGIPDCKADEVMGHRDWGGG